MAESRSLFPEPSDAQKQALAIASAYLERAASQAGSCLLVWQPGLNIELLSAFREQIEQSAATCSTMLEIFDGWPSPGSSTS